MSRFLQVKVTKDIILNNKLIVKKNTKGMILNINNNIPFVRFSTGRMINISSAMLLAL